MTNDCKNINKFIMTIGQIPTSYLVSMTYEEQLLWLCNFLEKEIVPAITETTELVHQIKEYVDKYLTDVDEIKEQITQIFNDIFLLQQATEQNTQNISYLNTKLNDEVNALRTKINNDITNLKLYVDDSIQSNFSELKEYVDYNDNLLNEKIDNIDIGDLKIYDPTAGVINDLQIVINNLYQAGNKDGLTASEFDALDLTANGFDGYQITAYEFDSAGKTILV